MSWEEPGVRVVGSKGAAIGPDGTLYVATAPGSSTYSSAVVAIDSKTLKPKDWFSVSGHEFVSSPLIFQYRNQVVVAEVTKAGEIYLLNTESLGGQDHKTPLCKSSGSEAAIDSDSLASWQDARMTRWLLAPTGSNRVTAWKIVDDQPGKPQLAPGWKSETISAPTAPFIINGVAFVATKTGPSTLYALDGATGKQLWKSGGEITSPAAALSGAGGQVYVTTNEGTLYAFGFPMEH
jgi:hypothetical protein